MCIDFTQQALKDMPASKVMNNCIDPSVIFSDFLKFPLVFFLVFFFLLLLCLIIWLPVPTWCIKATSLRLKGKRKINKFHFVFFWYSLLWYKLPNFQNTDENLLIRSNACVKAFSLQKIYTLGWCWKKTFKGVEGWTQQRVRNLFPRKQEIPWDK